MESNQEVNLYFLDEIPEPTKLVTQNSLQHLPAFKCPCCAKSLEWKTEEYMECLSCGKTFEDEVFNWEPTKIISIGMPQADFLTMT